MRACRCTVLTILAVLAVFVSARRAQQNDNSNK
jgi:hypothetical protein